MKQLYVNITTTLDVLKNSREDSTRSYVKRIARDLDQFINLHDLVVAYAREEKPTALDIEQLVAITMGEASKSFDNMMGNPLDEIDALINAAMGTS